MEESSQVHAHSLGERLCIQVHLPFVVVGKVVHVVVGSKHFLKGIPAKFLLELQEQTEAFTKPFNKIETYVMG